ncbi:MAG: glycoside hydrolase family 3 C-terminal domain-containing protein [Lachnospiraceae bacterium]|nr:glycoside hydrolase family 3 C-terminal domain-containing protein [Lachnospiraceae bacterium]
MNKWQRVKYQPNLPLGENGKKITACKEHRELSKEAAKEGMVLLKNENELLPLEKGSRLALFGKACFDYVKGGGGSGDVTVDYVVNLYDGLKSLGDQVSLCESLADFYRKDVEEQYAQGTEPGMCAEPVLPEELLREARAFADTAVISICRFSGEGWDRKSRFDDNKKANPKESPLLAQSKMLFERGDFYLSDKEAQMVSQVKNYFDRIAVVLNVGGVVDVSWVAEDEKISSALMTWQAGMEGGRAAAELLCGMGNPSGKLTDTFADLEDYPSTAGFHESDDYVNYKEDIYVGYRYFETIPGAGEKVCYPFGYGLSYTEFSRKVSYTEETEGQIRIRMEVTNIGKRAGKEVIQVYGQAPEGKLGKPKRVLTAFEKTRELQPGETQTLFLKFPVQALASYDDLGKVQKSAYVLEAGDYFIYAGSSVRDTGEPAYCWHLEKDMVVQQLSAKLVPSDLPERMCADGTMEALPMIPGNDPNASLIERTKEGKLDGCTPSVRAQEGRNLWEHPYKEGIRPLIDVAEGKLTTEEFVKQLTDEELIHLLGGQPNTGVANTFGFGNLPEYGIPNVMTADGPAGLRIVPECGVHTTAWPCATLLACSFNRDLVYRVGEAGAKEVKENNIGIWLTPAVNIHRSPLCGRNFEYYSEDPFLAGELASQMVKGIQSQHIAVSVKHFVCNNKETNRRNSDSRVSERAVREIYLKPFEIIVKNANPWSMMSSYNIVNGHRASECRELLEDILRGEWGYQGMVTTDWWTLGEHYKEVKAGNDVKMGCGAPESLARAVGAGVLSREEMEICGRRILELILKVD